MRDRADHHRRRLTQAPRGVSLQVCCGVTESCEDHAERVLKLATELVKVAQLVHVNDKPLTIRVGAHAACGPFRTAVVSPCDSQKSVTVARALRLGR